MASQDRTSLSVTLGHRYSQHIGSEVSYSFLGDDMKFERGRADAHELSVTGLFHRGLAPRLEGFARAGLAYTATLRSTVGENQEKWQPVFGLGVDYSLTPRTIVRSEVRFTNDFANTGAKVFNTTLGVNYRF